MKLSFAIVFVGASAIAAPAANAVDRHEQLVAQMKERDPEVRTKTLDVLREKNVDYQALATRNLKEDGETFDRARIEVDGVNANNDTAKTDPSLFDEPPVQPSHSAQDRSPGLINKLKRLLGHTPPADFALDVADYRSASNGEMTKRTRAVFDAWKNREINEVVAHSWGCEAVYAAIVNGYMLPPKKLILTGVPDNSFVKWQLLAQHTGTKVFWVRAENDTVAAELGTRIGNNKSWAEWNLDWESYCIPEKRSAICNAHGRTASTATKVSVGKLPSAGGHNRDEYYAVLKTKRIIVGTPLDLRRAESAKKAAEITTVEKIAVEGAHREALKLVAQAREQRKIAEQDHDERLRYTLIEMAQRSCADPGSVTQAELDALPDPYQEDFKTSQGTPRGLDICAYMVYLDLGRGVSSEKIRAKATPSKPADTRAIPPGPQGAPTIREPVDAGATVPFNSVFPRLKDLAVTACASPAQVSVDAGMFRRSAPVYYSRSADDAIAASLSTGLGDCPRQLFYTLIETLRAGQGSIITDQWVRSLAAVYSTPPYVPPSSGGRCEEYGNVHCPH